MQFGLNASAGRVFRLGERRSFDVRFDSTNVLNHVTYTSWNTTFGNAQFGLPVSANAMRTDAAHAAVQVLADAAISHIALSC